MGLFDFLKPKSSATVDLTGLVVTFDQKDNFDIQKLQSLEDKIEEALKASGAGEYDGNEIAVGEAHEANDVILYMYGPDPEQIFKSIEPILQDSDLRPFKIILKDVSGKPLKKLSIK